ncbi:MAG: hypothetical protein JST86_01885 [Bacteroidetes bacterium]|nr:hypothetical protein [Bacteroidota bacterium]
MRAVFKRLSSAVCVMLIFATTLIGQGINNPINKISIASPSAAALGKYGDIPVSYHTGLPQINIPIYSVTAGPLSLPISVSYHASGLKVQEPASWTGAGWSLNSGGVITRSVAGLPDDFGEGITSNQTHGHYSHYGFSNYYFASLSSGGNSTLPDWQNFARGYKDGEPDLYFFNFGSYSGKFYFRDDRTPVIIPAADFKIDPYFTGTGYIQGFVITTLNGTKYYFGNTPGITGAAPVEYTQSVTSQNGVSTANVISSWYLNKIASADSIFSINLTYENETYGYHTVSMFPVAEPIPTAPQSGGGSTTPGEPGEIQATSFPATHGYDLVKNIVQGVRLTKISFPAGNVIFSTDGMAARTDLSDPAATYNADAVNQTAKPLGSIQINDGTTVVKKFNFSYSYFSDNTTPLPQDILNFAPALSTDKQRLKLESIQELSGDGTASKPPYYFSYFTEQVPRRLSFSIDHWGFNNGVTTNTGLIPTYTKYNSNLTTNVPGANRDAVWPAMRAGTLQQIIYPTGGYTLFEFEPNSVYNSSTTNVNVNLVNLTVHLYGQSSYSSSFPFTTNGNAMNVALNNTSNYSAVLTITNNSNAIVYTNNAGNGLISPINPLTLPQGTYTATLTLPSYSGLTGGCTAAITQWQSVTTNNTILVGGNRIKSITHSDGVSTNNTVTNYDYSGDNGLTSGILYNKPVYVGVIRNDLIKDIGYYNNTNAGFTQYPSVYGCLTFPDATCYKSPSSIRPMASTQGNHIGYAQVKVTQTGNGFSKYKYYGTTGIPVWQANNGDIAITTVNLQGCNANEPNFPSAPLPFDYKRGELQWEAHYNESGQKLKESFYTPVFVDDPQQTPAFMTTSYSFPTNTIYLGTYYQLKSAHKLQMQVVETSFDPVTGISSTSTKTEYYESPYHNQVTRVSTTNSKNETVEIKNKYASDYRIASCDNIADGYTQYTSDCASCLATYNVIKADTSCKSLCQSNAYLNYQQCLMTARVNYVAYRKTNFTNPVNTFKTNHDNAKAAADAELKPVLQLQDDYNNALLETSKWKNGNLLIASFNRYDFSATSGNKVYLNKVQAINIGAPSTTFTPSIVSTSSTGLVKDTRYSDESTVKYYNGNIAEITGKDGIPTAYIWGYNNTLPIVQSNGISHTALLSAYNGAGGTESSVDQIRPYLPQGKKLVSTYTYIPITGMTKETNVSGTPTSYEYDKLQRLLLVRDLNGNIVKQYDYRYQVLPPSGSAQWIATGNTRCKPCPQNNAYLTNILQQEERDMNPISATYNTLRWNDAGTSSSCVSNADWQNTTTAVRCRYNKITHQYTGEQEQEQMDMNPCSSTYGQTQWVVIGVNYNICPVPTTCNSQNCTGVNKKCINGNCETGVRVNDGTRKIGTGTWQCAFHYVWSDGSTSPQYTETNPSPCY